MTGYHAKFTLLHEEKCLGNEARFVFIILLIEAYTREMDGRDAANNNKMLHDI
jgi:hypothetical protein